MYTREDWNGNVFGTKQRRKGQGTYGEAQQDRENHTLARKRLDPLKVEAIVVFIAEEIIQAQLP